MRNRFTEQDTEAFYDAEDALYRSFWDSEGSLHWGWFDPDTGDDFLKACANLNQNMAEKANIQVSSQVLDMGCGNGTTATWLAKTRPVPAPASRILASLATCRAKTSAAR